MIGRSMIVLVPCLLLLGGCSTNLLEYTPDEVQGPTIQDLEHHITCELYEAMDGSSAIVDTGGIGTKKVGDILREYNFVGSATITVGVTDTGGLNPSLTFINPTDFAGVASSTINKSDSIGGQASVIRDRLYTFVYNIDMSTFGGKARPNCADVPIKGTLEIGNVLRDGIQSIVATETNNYAPAVDNDELIKQRAAVDADLTELDKTYHQMIADQDSQDTKNLSKDLADNKVPLDDLAQRAQSDVTDTDVTHVPLNWAAQELLRKDKALAQALSTKRDNVLNRNRREQYALTALTVGGPSSSAPKSGGGAPAVNTYFSSQIDFSLTLGLNGGLSWSLAHFKGPNGGTMPLLSLSRAKSDTLQIAFVATCKSDDGEKAGSVAPPRNYWDTVPSCKGIPGGAAQAKSAATYQLQLNNNLTALPQEIRRTLQGQ